MNVRPDSYMSRTTDLGERSVSSTHGMRLAVEPQRLLERLGQRPRVRDLLEQLHPLLVLDAVGLHLGDGLPALLVRLRHQHRRRVVEDRLDDGEHVERVGLRLGVEQVERGLREEASGWLSAKSACSTGASRSVRPCSSGSASASSTPEASSSSLSDRACSARRARPRSSSWLSSISVAASRPGPPAG